MQELFICAARAGSVALVKKLLGPRLSTPFRKPEAKRDEQPPTASLSPFLLFPPICAEAVVEGFCVAVKRSRYTAWTLIDYVPASLVLEVRLMLSTERSHRCVLCV